MSDVQALSHPLATSSCQFHRRRLIPGVGLWLPPFPVLGGVLLYLLPDAGGGREAGWEAGLPHLPLSPGLPAGLSGQGEAALRKPQEASQTLSQPSAQSPQGLRQPGAQPDSTPTGVSHMQPSLERGPQWLLTAGGYCPPWLQEQICHS